MAKSEYLLLAHVYRPVKDNIAGWYVSEKLDGCRAFWDGGVSRGELAANVRYANIIKDTKPVVATGLWSRTGKVIHAPDSWLDALPDCLLDGELYLGPGRFQELRTVIGPHVPSPRWGEVGFKVFDSPTWEAFTKVREIKIRNDYSFWVRSSPSVTTVERDWPYDFIIKFLKAKLAGNPVATIIEQEQLPLAYYHAVDRLEQMLDKIAKKDGEGVMLRQSSFRWRAVRSHGLLKYKPIRQSQATVTGFTAGKGRLVGRIGALVVDFNGKRLELSGMTDEERVLPSDSAAWAEQNPGADLPFTCPFYFTIGQLVKFKYRELSDDGIPKEARYTR